MKTQYLELHNRYRARALAALSSLGADSASYVANWRIVKSLETDDPTKHLLAALAKAEAEAEGSESLTGLNKYWELQVRLFRQAIAAVGKIDRQG